MANELNTRQWALYNLLKNNPDRRFLQWEISAALPEQYPPSIDENFHDSATRITITKDIRTINDSDVIQKVIISNNQGVKLASREEFEEYIKAEYASIFRRLKRTHKKAAKGGLDGQMKLPIIPYQRNTVEAFTDSISRLKAARLSAGLKLTEVVAAIRSEYRGYEWLDVPLLSKMENGYCQPSPATISVLSEIYGLDSELYPEEENDKILPFANDGVGARMGAR